MVSLKQNELEQYNHLTPWVGSLFVHPYYRRSGLGQKLMTAVEKEALNFGFTDLYLFSSDAEKYYLDHHNGWEVLERFPDPIEPTKQIPLMKKKLSSRQ
jgi:GNAT superfamily N-acetyltransferase